MSRRWTFMQPAAGDDGTGPPEFVTMTEEQIRAEYYPHWCAHMKLCGYTDEQLEFEICLQDWIVVHWAWPGGKEDAVSPDGFRD